MDTLYCNIHPLDGESVVDAVVRTVSSRERALSGLALKIMLLRLQKESGKFTEQELQDCQNEFKRINNMIDEEYDRQEKEVNKDV